MKNYQLGMANHSSSGIERMINFSMPYNHLEMQLNQNQLLQEPEDRPETFHTPWGVWLHWRDALHHIDQTYDAKHVVRTGMVAEDILHYAHYVPVIGENDHTPESYGMSLEYDYSQESELYNLGINIVKGIEESGSVEIIDPADAANEEPPDADMETDLDEINAVEDEKGHIIHDNKQPGTGLNLKLEAQLTIIFEKFLITGING